MAGRKYKPIAWPNDREPTREDWIRLAAFIDGEGCIRTQSNGAIYSKGGKSPKHDLLLMIGNTDPRLGQWCMSVFGGKIYNHKYANPRCRNSYHWHAVCNRAKAIIRGCLPFLLLKREQAELALALAATYENSSAWFVRVPDEIVARRMELAVKLRDLKKATVFPPLVDKSEGDGKVM